MTIYLHVHQTLDRCKFGESWQSIETNTYELTNNISLQSQVLQFLFLLALSDRPTRVSDPKGLGNVSVFHSSNRPAALIRGDMVNTSVFWTSSLAGFFWVWWLVWAIHTWRLHFSLRVARSNPSSPSSGRRPMVRPALQSCPVLLGKGTVGSKGSCPFSGTQNFQMDMNHVRLTLGQYLWAAHCVALPAFALVVFWMGLIQFGFFCCCYEKSCSMIQYQQNLPYQIQQSFC